MSRPVRLCRSHRRLASTISIFKKLAASETNRSLSASPAHAHDVLKFSWNATDHVKALPGLLPSGRRAATAAVISCYPASKAPTLAVVCYGLGSLTEDGLSYKESFMVRSCEVGINKTATVKTMANLLQEAACNHIQSLGFSTDGFATTSTMRKMNLIWVTARMHIEIYKYPAWSDVVEIETWFHGEGRIGTRRDWILKDYANGQVIGRATSKWVMMNQKTRRLQKVNDDVRDEYLIFSPRESRLAFPEEDNSSLKKIAKLEDPAQYSRLGLVPRRADLDMNQHVNNVTYIGWVLEVRLAGLPSYPLRWTWLIPRLSQLSSSNCFCFAVPIWLSREVVMPQEIIDSYELQTITLDYRRECQHSDVVDSLSSHEPDENLEAISQLNGTNGSAASPSTEDYCHFLHLLRLSGDGLEINRGRTQWRKKPMM
ncbi:hypothetical protein ACJRO7_030165 [Eucalyptus globulus]|uniref:Acyl-[acyl-carrier-protein] hydrolase n=1 Tax=Eucalyptus globulus TaxID=34317 RepID=A0ABD3JGL7_EUCGL